MKIHPSFFILYLLAISTLIFAFHNLYLTVGLFALQLLLWLIARIPLREIRRLKKVISFALIVLFFHTFFAGNTIVFKLFSISNWTFGATSDGFYAGLFMVAKFITLLATTILVRLILTPEEFIRGLRGVGVTKNLSQMLNAILEALESSDVQKMAGRHGGGGGHGGGHGGGGGRGGGHGGGQGGGGGKRRESQESGEPTTETNDVDSLEKNVTFKNILKGDFTFLIALIQKRLDESKKKMGDNDIAVLTAISLIVALIRFMQITPPGLPIAPGNKNLLLIPFFILSTRLTTLYFPATTLGFVSGVIHFISGFGGKYGPFSVIEFIVLGLTVDLLSKLTLKSNSIVIFAIIGFLAGATRVTAAITVASLLGMPREFFLAYAPFIFSQCMFGLLSAPISKYFVTHIKAEERKED